jgi:hypothetical protein
MKRSYLIVLLFTFSFASFGQVVETEKELVPKELDSLVGWKIGGLLSLNLSQVSLTNWNAGGQNSLSMNSLIHLHANLTTEKTQWENSLNLGYGLLGQGRNKNINWIKTDDEIDITSKYGRKASENWWYSGFLNFSTQATPGYNYPNDSVQISKFMAPGYLLVAAGMDLKVKKIFSAFVAPFTMKGTFVADQTLADLGSFGVEAADSTGSSVVPGRRSRYEMGGYIRLSYEQEIMKNIKISSKLSLFSNYLENPENIDVTWENLIQFKVNKYISATLTTHLIYDDDIDIAVFDSEGLEIGKGPRVQFKEVLGIGFAYKFQ